MKSMYEISWYLLLLCLSRAMTAAAAPPPVTTIRPVQVQSSNNLIQVLNSTLITGGALRSSNNVIQVSNTTSTTGRALTYREIALNIEYLGAKIPEKEVRDTLHLAEAAIAISAYNIPDERIPTNEFVYSRAGSNMLIVITADATEGLTWAELARVLQTLYQFMTGTLGHSGEHYNALNFQLEDVSRNVIGNGVVWYLPPLTPLHSVQ